MARHLITTAILLLFGTSVHAQTENKQNENGQAEPVGMPPPVTQTEVLRKSINEHTQPPVPANTESPIPAGKLEPNHTPNTPNPTNPGSNNPAGTQGSTSGVPDNRLRF